MRKIGVLQSNTPLAAGGVYPLIANRQWFQHSLYPLPSGAGAIATVHEASELLVTMWADQDGTLVYGLTLNGSVWGDPNWTGDFDTVAYRTADGLLDLKLALFGQSVTVWYVNGAVAQTSFEFSAQMILPQEEP